MTVVEEHDNCALADPRGRTLPAHITIKHWQLKNLLCLDKSGLGENRLLYCCRNSVRSLDVRTSQMGFISPKLSFEPRSLCSDRGYIVAGAEHGTIAVIHGPGIKNEYEVDGSLVNGLHVYNGHDGQDRVLVSNNDNSLKFFNLATRRSESSIELPAAMNHASTTPDGKMLAAVGDSTEAYIFVRDSDRWRKFAEITVADDPCFSAVFSPSQNYLAVGSQDGTCTILDTRKMTNNVREASGSYGPPSAKQSGTLVHRARSSRPFPHGSIRSLAWSPSPLDLLLFTESTSYATLLDSRDFTQQQRIRIPDGDGSHFGIGGRDREISGACFSKTGEFVYVGSEQGITEFKIKTRERRSFPTYTMR